MNFAARILVGPEVVTRGERAIDVRHDPILFAGGLKGDRALNVIQAGDARGWVGDLGLRWVLILGCGDLRQSQKQGCVNEQKKSERELFGHELDTFIVRTGNSTASLRNQLEARNHANQITMRVSDMAA